MNLLLTPPSISFVKIDVEGHEPRVLAGAKKLLEARTSAWLVEASGDAADKNSPTGETFAIFRRYGYSPYFWDHDEIRPLGFGRKVVNVIFLPDAHHG